MAVSEILQESGEVVISGTDALAVLQAYAKAANEPLLFDGKFWFCLHEGYVVKAEPDV